jgi:hypothetical protein
MNRMAGSAALANGLVFENERPGLCRMALPAGLMFGSQGCTTPSNCWSFVRIMTITAAYFSFQNRMMIWKVELSTLIQMALEAYFRRFFGIDDSVRSSAALVMNAARTVTRLTTNVLGIFAEGLQTGVCGGMEIPRRIGMALLATFGTDEFGARDLRWHNDCACYRCAGNRYRGEDEAKQKQPHRSAAAPAKPDQSVCPIP